MKCCKDIDNSNGFYHVPFCPKNSPKKEIVSQEIFEVKMPGTYFIRSSSNKINEKIILNGSVQGLRYTIKLNGREEIGSCKHQKL